MKTMKIKRTPILPRCDQLSKSTNRAASPKPAYSTCGWESSFDEGFNSDLDEQDPKVEESDEEMRDLLDEITPSNDTLLKMAEKNPPDQSWYDEPPQEPPEN